jgi:hypothetical protein
MHRNRRSSAEHWISAVAVLTLAATLAGGCAGASHSQQTETGDTFVGEQVNPGSIDPHGMSSCSLPYTVRSPSGTNLVGSCEGTLSSAMAASVHLQVGQTFSVASTIELDGFPEFQPPDSKDPSVVQMVLNDPSTGTTTFRGERPGEATLTTVSIYCMDSPAATTMNRPATECPVVNVQVTE